MEPYPFAMSNHIVAKVELWVLASFRVCQTMERCSQQPRTFSIQPFWIEFLMNLLLYIKWSSLLNGGGGQDKSAKKCQFSDESLLFQIVLTTHSDYKTEIYQSTRCMPFRMAFQHVEFCTYADFCTGDHAQWLEAYQLKTQSSTCWKPEQQSFTMFLQWFLQCFSD